MSKQHSQHGFTIVELMFATAVFAVILLLCLSALIQLGRLYYKGVTTSQTQEAARNIIDEISQGIQLTGADISPPSFVGGPNIAPGSKATDNATGYFCLGDTRYSYVIDRKQTDGNSPDPQKKEISHVLWADSFPSCAGTFGLTPLDLNKQDPTGTNGRELVGSNMRLTRLNIAETPAGSGVFKIDVSVAYGDEDLFSIDTLATPNRKFCKTAQAGTQFCATSELSTIVKRRI